MVGIFGNDVVERHVIINGWDIDFYVKSISAYVQYDGKYYHGTGRTLDEVSEKKTKTDVTIYDTMLRDIKQIEWFSTHELLLVRISEKEFIVNKKQNKIVEFINGLFKK